MRFFNEGERIEHDLVPFLQTVLDDNEHVVAVTELQRTPSGGIGRLDPTEVPRLRLDHRGDGYPQNVLIPSHDHFDLGAHAGLQSFHRRQLNNRVVLHNIPRPPTRRAGDRSDGGYLTVKRHVGKRHSGGQPRLDAVDDGFVNADLHLHPGQVGHEQQNLILVDPRTLFDFGCIFPLCRRGVNYHPAPFGLDDTVPQLLHRPIAATRVGLGPLDVRGMRRFDCG